MSVNEHGTFLKYVKTTLPVSTHTVVMGTWFLYLIKCKLKFSAQCFECILIIVFFLYILVTCFYSLATASKSSWEEKSIFFLFLQPLLQKLTHSMNSVNIY